MSYSTINNANHILLCCIAIDKVLVDKEDNIEILQEKISLLTLELTSYSLDQIIKHRVTAIVLPSILYSN